jgi:hypothetical protein
MECKKQGVVLSLPVRYNSREFILLKREIKNENH